MNRSLITLLLATTTMALSAAHAAEMVVAPVEIAETKAVYGQIQPRNSVAARARIGGTVIELAVTEGDQVKAGDIIARIKDDKIDFQVQAVEAQLLGLQASLRDVDVELDRAERLLRSGSITAQRLDQLRTQRDVTTNQIGAAEAQRSLLLQQAKEGAVLSPADGRIISVPVTRQSVVMGGETIATIAGGGFFLRLAIPERHAASLVEGASISIGTAGDALTGRLAKVYPSIEGGRVTADVEVQGLDTRYVAARVPVDVPIGARQALLVPENALTSKAGVDFLTLREGEATVQRTVVTGEKRKLNGKTQVEILTGLAAGDIVVTP
ncbi:efflux RND transporter periplasmic adaptor subunit [Rhizobium sp. G187]|uniref:efflux RND transporter periplasmic adaptor subunit n=1 Tax=Rhizobium sp. G187 TaxID=3451352 RepID=UPI003EE4A6B8